MFAAHDIPRCFKALLRWGACAALAMCLPVLASTNVDPDATATLKSDEGLLLWIVDTDFEYYGLELDREGAVLNVAAGGASSGTSARLLRVPAGHYQVHEVAVVQDGNRFDLRDQHDLSFEVKAGTVTYPGTLLVRATGGNFARFEMIDSSALAVEAAERLFARQIGELPMNYGGKSPDGFAAFYRAERKRYPDRALPPTAENDQLDAKPEQRGIAAELLYRTDGTQLMRMNPAGDLLAEYQYSEDQHIVNLIDVVAGTSTEVYRGSASVNDLRWSGKRTLLLESEINAYSYRTLVIKVDKPEHGPLRARGYAIPAHGEVIDPLPQLENAIVFLRLVQGDSSPYQLFLLDISGDSIADSQFRRSSRLNAQLSGDSGWLIDRQGALRVALETTGGAKHIRYRKSAADHWHDAGTLGADDHFVPVAFAADGTSFYAISNRGHDQSELVIFDPVAGKESSVVYSRPGVDLEGAIVRPSDRAVIGARYYADGELRSEYFDEGLKSTQAILANTFPDQQVVILETSDDLKRAVVETFSALNPGKFFLCDIADKKVEELGDSLPLLARTEFVKPQLFTTKVDEAVSIESIITLPPGSKSAPLVVMPHGGPIGVRDTLSFNRDVQFLVSRGFAVLQVNYRGSEGFGRAFQESGYGNWGKRIEDDIEHALDQAIAHYPVDKDRVCMVGASYGGYSALMALVRSPTRFRCAVSIAGVSDVALMFGSSDWRLNPRLREQMTRIVGNPDSALRELQEISPVYQYLRIAKPVLLIHGGADRRVVIDHSERMRLLLRLSGVPVDALFIPGEGHAFRRVASDVKAQNAVADFLDRYLKSP